MSILAAIACAIGFAKEASTDFKDKCKADRARAEMREAHTYNQERQKHLEHVLWYPSLKEERAELVSKLEEAGLMPKDMSDPQYDRKFIEAVGRLEGWEYFDLLENTKEYIRRLNR